MFRGGKKHKKNKKGIIVCNRKRKDRDNEKLSSSQMQQLLSQFKLNKPNKVTLLYDYRYYQ